MCVSRPVPTAAPIEIQAHPDSRRHPVCSAALAELADIANAKRTALGRGELLEIALCSRDGQRTALPVLLTRHTPVTAVQLGQIIAAGLDELGLHPPACALRTRGRLDPDVRPEIDTEDIGRDFPPKIPADVQLNRPRIALRSDSRIEKSVGLTIA